MAVYKCLMCGHEYNESKEEMKFSELPDDWTCPICGETKDAFELVSEEPEEDNSEKAESTLDYLKEFSKNNSEYEEYMNLIHNMAVTGNYQVEPMKTTKKIISGDDILILGAQLGKFPLDENEQVSTQTIIGKQAKKPMVLDMPIIISHMSFGALSKNAKVALAEGSNLAHTATSSGEGGILEEEIKAASKYIFEYVPNKYSVTDENLKRVDAIEIKIGQGTKPGMGGQLPKEKVTEEIAKVRGKEVGKSIHSPSKFLDIKTKADLKDLVNELRKRSAGRPIGIKIAAGNIEEDMKWIEYAKPDFITIDGRGGATGASPKVIKDATSIPTIFALYRTKKYLIDHNLDIDLIITGGLRISSDFAKALAMGADAIAVATSAMLAVGCMQYRICQNGMCPMGVATQNEELSKRLEHDSASKRVVNFLTVSNQELKMFARITGNNDIHDLSIEDIVTTNQEISNYTNIKHV